MGVMRPAFLVWMWESPGRRDRQVARTLLARTSNRDITGYLEEYFIELPLSKGEEAGEKADGIHRRCAAMKAR